MAGQLLSWVAGKISSTTEYSLIIGDKRKKRERKRVIVKVNRDLMREVKRNNLARNSSRQFNVRGIKLSASRTPH